MAGELVTLPPVAWGLAVVPPEAGPFRQILDALPSAAYLCAPDGRITYFNAAAERLWGRRPALMSLDDLFCGSFRLFRADGEAVLHSQCWMALALVERVPHVGKPIFVGRPDGSRVRAEAHAHPLLDDGGALVGGVNILAEPRREELVPICAHCKDIRDPAGDWRAIELFFRDRHGVRFTHGICPVCLPKHYGEYLSAVAALTDT